jgi:hypothetical protein
MGTWPERWVVGESGPNYIPQLRITEEYKAIYSSTLYSSVRSSINRGI